MTNFFDVATPLEVAAQFASDGKTPMGSAERAFARGLLEKDKDHNLICLVFLFLSREDKDKALALFSQIENPDRQSEAALLMGELVEA